MPTIKPDSAAIQHYYRALQEAEQQQALNEGNVRDAFETLLRETARDVKGWSLVSELGERRERNRVEYDGVLRDENRLPHGWWEAKDTRDHLDTEIRLKRERGYRFDNIIFEDTRVGILFQNGLEVVRRDLRQPEQVADLLNRFYGHEIEPFKQFEEAVAYFQGEIPHIAGGLKEKIEAAHRDNRNFKTAFDDFMELCRAALNPNLSEAAADEMLIQHMLTERLIRKVFDVEEFTRRNVIAAEIEKVIDSLASQHFNRSDFLGALDRFYTAIENAADRLATFTEKQDFINHVYERFFQGYSVKIADTHGIVYTPQPIVDFMCAAVEEVLQNEFGVKLGDEGVYVIDPCTGTGNFAVNLLRRAHERNPRDFERFYREQLFANEVMLMPYYIASLNIEHEYYALTGHYEPFDGICFVDTLDMAEGAQQRFSFMTEKNTERVERQKAAPITVIIGNPPYNSKQMDDNDNNKNRKYEVIDKRVSVTYAKDSKASNKNALSDPFVKFFRWATDRLQERNGVVCYVSNSSFVDNIAFDGMRKHLLADFSRVYVVDLKGDIRRDSMRGGIPLGEKHTVFGLAAMVGISITVLVRNHNHQDRRLLYTAVPWRSTRDEKFEFLKKHVDLGGKQNALNTIEWSEKTPDSRHTWLIPEFAGEFATFLPTGNKETKAAKGDAEVVFKSYSGGVKTNRDDVVYDFNRDTLISRVRQFVEEYNIEVDRYKRAGWIKNIDNFVKYDRIKWSEGLKSNLSRGKYIEFDEANTIKAIYRPFCKRILYFDKDVIERTYQFTRFLPVSVTENDNRIICATGVGAQQPFASFTVSRIPDLNFFGSGTVPQWFPFYVYDADGTNRRENITDWALAQFRGWYGNEPLPPAPSPYTERGSEGGRVAAGAHGGAPLRSGGEIGKWDIFYYVYGLLHHPAYRERYADNLKRELPRIPFAPDFWAFSEAGRRLAELHLNYETVEPYELEWVTTPPVSYRVEKMRLRNPVTPPPNPRPLSLRVHTPTLSRVSGKWGRKQR